MPAAETNGRHLALPVVALLLFAVLLFSVRTILTPLLVFPVLVLVLWPMRTKPGIRRLLGAATGLTLAWFFYAYSALIGPFVAAAILAYLLDPVVDALERRRLRRGAAVLLATLSAILLIIAVITITAPQMWEQSVELVSRLPGFGSKLLGLLEGTRDRLVQLTFLTQDQRAWLMNLDPARVGELLQQNGDSILAHLGQWAGSLLGRLWSVVGLLGYLVVTPVVAYYLLLDWDVMMGYLRALLPARRRGAIVEFAEAYDRALGGFVRGQLVEAALVAVLTTAGLALLGVPNALLLGITCGVMNLIPYIGIVLSVIPALLVALTMPDPLGGLGRVGLVYGVVQFIDSNVTGPRIVGNAAGLHPVWIMLALALGGAMLGFAGLLLAVPLAILIRMVGTRVVAMWKESASYRNGALATDRPDGE